MTLLRAAAVAVLLIALPRAVQAGTVRVLLGRAGVVELRSAEPMVLTSRGADGQWGLQSELGGPLTVKSCGAGICAAAVRGSAVHVQTEAAALSWAGRNLPNELTLTASGSEVLLIAELDIEVYLEGVLGREMSPSWPLEALKAQAVIARTYTYRRVSEGAKKAYDIQSTTADQVFEWGRAAGNTIRTAVLETEGWIITIDGSPIEAFFHADSGGFTVGTQDVWDKVSPGIEGRTDEYSPRQSWTVSLDPSTDGEMLGVGRLKSVVVAERVGGGRARVVEVRGTRATLKMSADQFRGKLGYARIKSAMFEPRGLTLEGRGYGHGIGMSQTGAKKMAELGYDWQDILDYYYPSTVLVPAE